uniref:Nudix hydrolase domain-containing protein n=1 Tax=Sphaeramia orbicularis TaxID=375764 RepID=A0A673AL92_9TELE
MMDPELSVLLHCADWRGLMESQIQVELSERFNRQTDPALERHIEELWTERISKEPWIFNGAKFRLHSFCLTSPKHPSCSESLHVPPLNCEEEEGGLNSRKTAEGLCTRDSLHPQNHLDQRNKFASQVENASCTPAPSSSTCGCKEEGVTASPSSKTTNNKDSENLLTLRLGLTSYKDYLGTNWSCQVEELRRRGEVEFGDPQALLAQPLGVGAVLCTDDGQVVLIRRSQRVAEAGGLLDIPGGHPEPKVVCERFGEVVSEEQINVEMLRPRSEAVVSELFSSICAEIRDEVNVPLTSLGEPVLMGIALNHTSAGRPSAEFYVSCSLTSDEVRKLYWKGGAEAHESTDIVFLSKNSSGVPSWRILISLLTLHISHLVLAPRPGL